MEIQGLPGRLLAELGPAIASGELPEGTVLRAEELEERFGVSRTVVREAVRILEGMRLVPPAAGSASPCSPGRTGTSSIRW